MNETVYEKLREQLDKYATGYPKTESGVEIKILKKLFSEEEAALFPLLGFRHEAAKSMAQRINRPLKEIEGTLLQMAEKGLIVHTTRKGVSKFGALPFAPGIWEQQIDTMDKELGGLYETYMQEVFHRNMTETGPILIHRPVPINRVVDVSYPMATYENSREIVNNQGLIAVVKCICRVQKGAIEEGCNKPLETCLMFESQARYYIDRGLGREITRKEAVEILEQCEEAGLMTMPFNSQTPANICNCCADCCMVIASLKRHPRPVELIRPRFQSAVEQELCEGCETCLERCPMDAIIFNENVVEEVNLDLCLGCGLCVSTCPTEALHLMPIQEEKPFKPPETDQKLFMEMAVIREKSLRLATVQEKEAP